MTEARETLVVGNSRSGRAALVFDRESPDDPDRDTKALMFFLTSYLTPHVFRNLVQTMVETAFRSEPNLIHQIAHRHGCMVVPMQFDDPSVPGAHVQVQTQREPDGEEPPEEFI